jgi:hypothetical protein
LFYSWKKLQALHAGNPHVGAIHDSLLLCGQVACKIASRLHPHETFNERAETGIGEIVRRIYIFCHAPIKGNE